LSFSGIRLLRARKGGCQKQGCGQKACSADAMGNPKNQRHRLPLIQQNTPET